MKKINMKWKYGLVAFAMVAFCACSEQEDLSQMVNRPNLNGTRTAEWNTRTVSLDSIGTLEAKLQEVMAGEELSTLEKLVVSGPMAAADFNYMQNNLRNLYALDLKDVTITALPDGDNWYYGNYSSQRLKNDTICRYMFAGRSYLREIVLPTNLKGLDEYAFYNCDSLTSVVIPDGVKLLRNSTFRYCRRLSSITLPANLEGIESQVFYDCDSLKTIVIQDKVKFIGNNAFYGCGKLSSVEFSLASQLDSIAEGSFMDVNLKSINIPNKVRTIGNRAFSNCDSLVSVILPSNLEVLGNQAFYYCRMLKSINIPEKVKYIGSNTFDNCRMLSSVEFSSNSELDSIAHQAFDDTNLKTLVLPDKVKYIGDYAFYSNDSLANVTIPNGVQHIGRHTFYGCHGLTELIIPESVTSIEDGFANNCNNLRNVIWNASVNVPYNSISEYALLYVNTDTEITVHESWKNVIKNGLAQSTITIQAENNQKFAILKEFTAPEVVYTRHFDGTTTPGVSSGWQTIVLPFTPDSIYHESKGRVAPFNSGVEDAKPFWLRELAAEGFVDVTTMTPDKAYIIAMPNHSDYLDEYCLYGSVTFTAKNVTLAKTPDVLESSIGPDFELHPTYGFVKKALYIYMLQNQWGDYNGRWCDKSFFVRSASDVHPFNAYVTAPGGGRSAQSTFDLDTRSSSSRTPYTPNKTGIPQIGDM